VRPAYQPACVDRHPSLESFYAHEKGRVSLVVVVHRFALACGIVKVGLCNVVFGVALHWSVPRVTMRLSNNLLKQLLKVWSWCAAIEAATLDAVLVVLLCSMLDCYLPFVCPKNGSGACRGSAMLRRETN